MLLEVCVDSYTGLINAVEGGADRIELCSALDIGGLTPSPGLIAKASEFIKIIPIYSMIRPRQGNFIYSDYEIETMEKDIEAIRVSGMSGVVFGVNLNNFKLNEKMLEKLCKRSQGLGKTLHRCFDLIPNLNEGIETAINLNFDRILTSGLTPRVIPEGIPNLQRAVEISEGKISIMPGSGINSENISELIKIKGIIEVHSSCSEIIHNDNEDNFKKLMDFGFTKGLTNKITCKNEVKKLKDKISHF